MASSPPTNSPPPLPPPGRNDPDRSWEAYRWALSRLTIPELLEHLTRINAAQEAQARSLTATTAASLPSLADSLSSLDRIAPGPTAPASPWPTDRGGGPSPASPQPSAVDRLAATAKLGPRIAARLLLASARAQRRRADE